ncbi:MAG TPA: glutamine synthetase, partial [Haliea salexigens]|nr:glutamine synthetase [Haliea salexigens]
EGKAIPTVCSSLSEALKSLDEDRSFLTAGGVFTDDMIDGYIDLKASDIERLNMTTHPVEFDM